MEGRWKQYEEWVNQYESMIHRVCRIYSRSDDYHFRALCQEVAYALWKEWSHYRLSRFRREARESSWVYGIIVNTIQSYYKKYGGKMNTVSLPEQADALLPPCTLTAAENADDLLASLSPRNRRLVMLWMHGYKNEEIAELESLTAAAVATRISRALDKLRKLYNK